MKALRASAGTSQPVLTGPQVQTVFYQVPEIRDIHQSFYSGLKAQLSSHCLAESCSGGQEEAKHPGFSLIVGDLFLKTVSCLRLNLTLWLLHCLFFFRSFFLLDIIVNRESFQVNSSPFLCVIAAAGEPAGCVRRLHRKLRGRRWSGPAELTVRSSLPAAGWGNADCQSTHYSHWLRLDNWLTASLLQSMMPNNNSSDKTQCKYTFEGTV